MPVNWCLLIGAGLVSIVGVDEALFITMMVMRSKLAVAALLRSFLAEDFDERYICWLMLCYLCEMSKLGASVAAALFDRSVLSPPSP